MQHNIYIAHINLMITDKQYDDIWHGETPSVCYYMYNFSLVAWKIDYGF